MDSNNFDVIIVGAGAAGLAAGLDLARAGRRVAIVEARNRIGGRINTIQPAGFDEPIEAGAEFVHGDLPVTLKLLKEYKIPYTPTGGEMWRTSDGQLIPDSFDVPGFDKLYEELHKLKSDTSVQQFLDDHFSNASYRQLYISIQRFVEGFDTGDISSASIFKFREEWSSLEEEEQYRVQGGYCRLMDALRNDFETRGGLIFLSSPADTINWSKGTAQVSVTQGKTYTASKILITVPLGVLQAEQGAENYIRFESPLPEKILAAQKLGYGAILKAVLRFSEVFWQRIGFVQKNVGFIFSDTLVPTMWTRLPARTPILTAWIGGPIAGEWQYLEDEQVLKIIINSLATVFGLSEDELQAEIKASHISNWTADPFTKGSYSFAIVAGEEAVNELLEPVEETIFFAGEAVYKDSANGTVEAALSSGIDAAKNILASRRQGIRE